jgi:hypothetical protein
MDDAMRHTVLLNGGLGNQLFQLAALFAGGVDHKIGFDSSLGFDKHASFMGQSLSQIKFPVAPLQVRQKHLILFKKLIANHLLKNGQKTENPRIRTSRFLAKQILTMFLFLDSRVKYKIITESDVDTYLSNPKENYYLIGYFQTSRWSEYEEVQSQFKDIEFQVGDDVKNQAKKLSENQILGIHFRIGDYVMESDAYGVLPNSYYADALTELNLYSERKILFSDSPTEASKRLLQDLKVAHEVAPASCSATETLFLMSSCQSLIIANSSLSWWGAKIGNLKGVTKEVVAPNPWFRLLTTEMDLVKDNWHSVKPWKP